MSHRELQDGADWLYSQFYRLDRILWRTVDTLLTTGPVPAALTLKLNLTYRYDNKREGIVGRNPAPKREAGLMARLHEWFGTAKPQTAGYRIDATERRALNRMGPYNIHLQRRAG